MTVSKLRLQRDMQNGEEPVNYMIDIGIASLPPLSPVEDTGDLFS
jgi:hypothetical protein